MGDHLSFQTIFLEIFPSTYQMNTWPTPTLGPSWLHFVRVVLTWNQTKDAGWHDDVESVQIFASACIICLFHQYSYKITWSFCFYCKFELGTQLFVCSIQSRKTGFIILYKQKAEKAWWVTLDKLATHATLAYYRHHQYMLLGTKSRTHSHVTAALEASNTDFYLQTG